MMMQGNLPILKVFADQSPSLFVDGSGFSTKANGYAWQVLVCNEVWSSFAHDIIF